MKIIRIILSCIYALLCIYAPIAAMVTGVSTVIAVVPMLIGGILLLLSNYKYTNKRLYLPIAALVLIHISALLVGIFQGAIHPIHHIVRLFVSLVVILLFYFSDKTPRSNLQ